ncbi:MAG: efflux RND transporter periplasmic adaptor subunit [Desulfocapsaceae bacterium]|nr:efflux RND transporter periplasmic adaptor subunit [Desulfocapsaceae bacterium]
MKYLSNKIRTLTLVTVIALLLAVFFYVVIRSGPLAPIAVTVTTVTNQPITPALFGIGTIQARYTHRLGPTVAGRVQNVNVHVGDKVKAGQILAEIDPIDLKERITGQDAALKRAEALTIGAEAQVKETVAGAAFAASQASRYSQLFEAHSISAEADEGKRQENRVAEAALATARANLDAARQDRERLKADRAGLIQQQENLRLLAPIDGLVVARDAEPGDTVVAGQAIVEMIDPASLWINVRFDQSRTAGLRAELPAVIARRSSSRQPIAGRVLRVEPLADAVTEETLAKVVFDPLPEPLPPIGELAEITVALPALPAAPVIPNGALKRANDKNSRNGVWIVKNKSLTFAPVRTGATDLDGQVQILDGIKEGDQVVVYSQRELTKGSRVKIVDHLIKDTP